MTKQRKKILVIGSYAESLLNFRLAMILSFLKEGASVHVCVPEFDQSVYDKLSELGVQYHSFSIERTGTHPLGDLKYLFFLWKLMRSQSYSHVLSYTIKPVIYGSIAARFAGVPLVSSMITGLGYLFVNQSFKARVLRALIKPQYRYALKSNSLVFFQNPDDRKDLLSEGILNPSQKFALIAGSGVDVNHFHSCPLPDYGTTFLMIGRLVKDKGVIEYVNAARVVKSRYPESRFLLAGWIDENPASISENQLDEWREESLIEYLGKLEDVRSAICKSHVYVLPSYREGTPRTVLEAMSLGRAIVTTDAPGCRETVIENVNGFLVPPRNVAQLAERMMMLCQDRQLIQRMGKESRSRAVEVYDVDKVNETIVESMDLRSQ